MYVPVFIQARNYTKHHIVAGNHTSAMCGYQGKGVKSGVKMMDLDSSNVCIRCQDKMRAIIAEATTLELKTDLEAKMQQWDQIFYQDASKRPTDNFQILRKWNDRRINLAILVSTAKSESYSLKYRYQNMKPEYAAEMREKDTERLIRYYEQRYK